MAESKYKEFKPRKIVSIERFLEDLIGIVDGTLGHINGTRIKMAKELLENLKYNLKENFIEEVNKEIAYIKGESINEVRE